jgi:hypothetical protein
MILLTVLVAMAALHDEEVAARQFLATLDRTDKP